MKRLLFITILSLGCQDLITVENLPASITSIGPIEVLDPDLGTVSVQFTVHDPEGDDIPILFEVCDSQSSACGSAVIDQRLSDKLGRTTTAPKGTDVTHVVVWNVACGRFDGAQRLTSDADGEYVARLSILDGEGFVESSTFDLSAISDLDQISCER